MDNLGGFDVEFVLEEKDDLKCSICLLVLREPMQAEQCGHRFCKGCVINLPKSDKKGYICPIDRSKMTLFQDKGREREILDRLIKCVNHTDGCCWTNELRELQNHVKNCEYEELVCTMTGCGTKFQRRFFSKHNEEDCVCRMMSCPFCFE
eukprot:TCONS_00052628-protein